METGTIVFINKTHFTVHLVRGSGRIDVAVLAPFSSENIPNTFGAAEDYYPLYDVPLTASFSLSRIRPDDIDFYFRSDNQKDRQKIEITVPESFSDASAYIIFTNSSRSGGVSLSQNTSVNRMTGINYPDAKSNINEGETLVYQVNPRDIQSLRINPQNIDFGETAYRPGFIYSYTFSGSAVTLTDSRPLRRAGEPAWVKTIPEAVGPMPLVSTDGEIHLFVSTDRNLVRYDYDSTGSSGTPIPCGDSFEISYAVRTGDGFFVVGYEKLSDWEHLPVARIQGEDGAARRILEPSNRREYRSAYFLTAAQKDNSTWLAAGGGAENSLYGYTAYARLVRDNGRALTADWELGGLEFDARTPPGGARCGAIRSAAYDPGLDRWLITGENLEFDSLRNPVTGSYIAVINSAGVIQKIDTSFRGMSFYKLVPDSGGNYYAIGEELKGRESFAVIIKYNADGRELWRLSNQPPSYSFYEDALLDAANNRIILAGTLRANNEYGQGGIPFIDAVDTEKNTLLWREELSGPDLAGTALVTAIAHAPDYGFAITLSGAGNSYEKPFMIARVNSQGKLLKEIQQ